MSLNTELAAVVGDELSVYPKLNNVEIAVSANHGTISLNRNGAVARGAATDRVRARMRAAGN